MRSISSLARVKHNISPTQLIKTGEDVTDTRVLQLKPTKLPPLPRTRDLLHAYGLKAKKNLSQNFLLNSRLLRGLVRAAGISPGHRVIEVGPGPGNLTRAILEKSPFEVLALEKDRRFLPLLEQLADSVLPGQLKILLGDALNHDLNDIFGEPDAVVADYKLNEKLPDYLFNFSRAWDDNHYPLIRIIGNLPFSVSTPLLIKWLHHISNQTSLWKYGRVPMLLTFQEEVARRICAEPASAERSRLSVMSQNYCHVDYKFTISGKSFTPQAGVDTGVVRFYPRNEPFCKVPFKLFEKFVRSLFHHRNHTLDYNYKTLYPRDMQDMAYDCFRRARVDRTLYPFMVSNREAARLCDQYYEHCQQVPALVEFDYRASKKLLGETSLKILKEAGLDLIN